jgi:membrane protein DedA with SNARE-associated domain
MDSLYSYLGIIVALVLTGCGLPLPEEAFIVAAGIAASLNELNPILAFAACMIGALIGDTIMYGMGRVFGRGLMRRSGWWSKVFNAQTEARAEQMIKRHGLKVFLLARFLVGVRAPMYIAAGILRIPLTRFLFIDGICATVVIAIVFGLSWQFGHHFEPVWQRIRGSQVALTIAIVLVGAMVGLYLLWLLHRRSGTLQAATISDPPPAIAPQQHATERLEEAHGVG